jgi:mannose-6-phosphate isomerase-like protein (cupin superfamily)
MLCSSILVQFRVVERLRLWQRYCFNTDESLTLYPFRVPISLVDVQNEAGKVKNAAETPDDGSIRLLVTPRTAVTNSMHISLVCIAPGRELTSNKSPAVEFYYVVSSPAIGAFFSQQGVIQTTSLKTGDCFVVDIGSMRWISNRDGSSPLLLIRVTDGGLRYDYASATEQIRLDSTLKKNQNRSIGIVRVSTMDRLKDGLRQVQSIAKKYVYRQSNGDME